ncbi:beta-glucosidase [Klebsormidium nitens]|uniref:Beta-glucosidase n=1 Tax=Klebsormidium nitens TaxID=105231 RepID=A0A1Y1IDV5_KLENI|nr:beta-glucosidase [Klebsormidium nitens]|eukprot:GAQ89145.1 beta-glucosidase [Klebsormidium nitens]
MEAGENGREPRGNHTEPGDPRWSPGGAEMEAGGTEREPGGNRMEPGDPRWSVGERVWSPAENEMGRGGNLMELAGNGMEPGDPRRRLGDRGWSSENRDRRLGETGYSLGGAVNSQRETKSCPGEKERVAVGPAHAPSLSEGALADLAVGFEGLDPTAGFRREENSMVGGQLRSHRDQQIWGAEAQGIEAEDRPFATSLRSLRRKPVNQMTVDDFPELMDLFRRNSPVMQQLPADSVPRVPGFTHVHNAAQSGAGNSPAPSSLASDGGSGVKRPHSLDANPSASLDSARTRKRGAPDPSQTPVGVSEANGAEAATLAPLSGGTPSPLLDGGLDTSAPESSSGTEDVQLMKDTGLECYRFSISSSILPKGRGDVNAEGVAFYDQLIDELLRQGPTPRDPHPSVYRTAE